MIFFLKGKMRKERRRKDDRQKSEDARSALIERSVRDMATLNSSFNSFHIYLFLTYLFIIDIITFYSTYYTQ